MSFYAGKLLNRTFPKKATILSAQLTNRRRGKVFSATKIIMGNNSIYTS